MSEPTKCPRVCDETLTTICGILAKTEGIGPSETTFGDALRACARDLRDARAELREGDYWQQRAKEALRGGTCPICFRTDEAGHKDGCLWGKDEADVERWRAEAERLAEVLGAARVHMEDPLHWPLAVWDAVRNNIDAGLAEYGMMTMGFERHKEGADATPTQAATPADAGASRRDRAGEDDRSTGGAL